MGDKTTIAWTDATFSYWYGCSHAGPGCQNCYAEALMDKRWHRVEWGPGKPRQLTSEANRKQPLKWEREHAAFFAEHGHNRRVFCSSLGDVFDNEVPAYWRVELFNLIEATPHLTWQLLTKRIGNVPSMLAYMKRTLPANVWLGITVVNQEEVDRDIPKLLAVPARIRFLSLEPLLGPVHFFPVAELSNRPISMIIVGGESGPRARPMDLDWVRSIRDQCEAADVPFFFKQVGGLTPTAGGCALDGKEYKDWPRAA